MKRLLSLIVAVFTLLSVGGVFATWRYAEIKAADGKSDVAMSLGNFLFAPEDMPDVEVSVLQRLSDILNRRYTTEKITDSLDYLLNETIQVYWGGNIYADPYVGSMDANFSEQIDELFRDVLFESGVSFLLKSQDLNNDGYREVAMYSTSDPLTCEQEYDGIVCVFVSVFTPIIDGNKDVVGYSLVCESLRGYCYEVFYDYDSLMPSFSTDTWLDDVGYNYYGVSYSMPEPARHDYNCYNHTYYPEQWWSSRTFPLGNNLYQCLYNKIPFLT